MCLSVYLGCRSPLDIGAASGAALGAEPASWTPPPLSDFARIYYFGRKSGAPALECSCLLAETIDWCQTPPTVVSDSLYPTDGPCPFETLQAYVRQAVRNDGYVVRACDDSGGTKQDGTADDYSSLPIRPSMIKRGNLLFASLQGGVPWRSFHIVGE